MALRYPTYGAKGMRCKACDAVDSTYRPSLKDFYCDECSVVIKEVIQEAKDQDTKRPDYGYLMREFANEQF